MHAVIYKTQVFFIYKINYEETEVYERKKTEFEI